MFAGLEVRYVKEKPSNTRRFAPPPKTIEKINQRVSL